VYSPLIPDHALAGVGVGDTGKLAFEGRGRRPAAPPSPLAFSAQRGGHLTDHMADNATHRPSVRLHSYAVKLCTIPPLSGNANAGIRCRDFHAPWRKCNSSMSQLGQFRKSALITAKSALPPGADIVSLATHVRFAQPAQPVDATQASNLSAGVSNAKVLRGRSFSWRATLFR
jgi:hypothetical protein